MYYLVVVVPSYVKDNSPKGHSEEDLHEAKEQNTYKTKMKTKKVCYLFLFTLTFTYLSDLHIHRL